MNKISIDKSKSMAGIVGPTLVVMVIGELKLWNPTLYDQQSPPVVYLSGALLFIAGICIIRNHHIWILSWQTGLTMIGWGAISLGCTRIFFPQAHRIDEKYDPVIFSIEIVLILIGLLLTYKGYSPTRNGKK